jgi:hypothetical protein
MWQFIGAAIFLLVVLALFIVITFKHLHGSFRLVSGRVPMYRIASVLLVGVVGFAVLSPIMDHMERKRPLHLVVKPAAEDRVRASAVAHGLLGDQISFGSEASFHYNVGSQTGSGGVLVFCAWQQRKGRSGCNGKVDEQRVASRPDHAGVERQERIHSGPVILLFDSIAIGRI